MKALIGILEFLSRRKRDDKLNALAIENMRLLLKQEQLKEALADMVCASLNAESAVADLESVEFRLLRIMLQVRRERVEKLLVDFNWTTFLIEGGVDPNKTK